MSKRHFEALANAFASIRPTARSEYMVGARDQWITDVQNVANVCQQFNPAFNRVKFVEACENRRSFA